MKKLLLIISIGLLSGCSTGIVSMDKGTYMVASVSNWPHVTIFRTGSGQKAEVYEDANRFCNSANRDVETLDIKLRDGITFIKPASAELDFRCVDRTVAK